MCPTEAEAVMLCFFVFWFLAKGIQRKQFKKKEKYCGNKTGSDEQHTETIRNVYREFTAVSMCLTCLTA